jgi:hypothetical protein
MLRYILYFKQGGGGAKCISFYLPRFRFRHVILHSHILNGLSTSACLLVSNKLQVLGACHCPFSSRVADENGLQIWWVATNIYWISSRGQPTWCGPPACRLGEVLTTPHLKKKNSFLRNVIHGLRIGGLFWTRSWISLFHKRRGISYITERLSASQEGVCSMELVS